MQFDAVKPRNDCAAGCIGEGLDDFENFFFAKRARHKSGRKRTRFALYFACAHNVRDQCWQRLYARMEDLEDAGAPPLLAAAANLVRLGMKRSS